LIPPSATRAVRSTASTASRPAPNADRAASDASAGKRNVARARANGGRETCTLGKTGREFGSGAPHLIGSCSREIQRSRRPIGPCSRRI
jgi:hypothetical protein